MCLIRHRECYPRQLGLIAGFCFNGPLTQFTAIDAGVVLILVIIRIDLHDG